MAEPGNIIGQKRADEPLPDYEQNRGLVDACIAGDRVAQRELYNKHSPILFGIIRRYVNDPNAGKEILSDAFLKIFTKLHMYSFTGALEGWMRKIVINCITDHVRKNIKHNQTISTEVASVDVYVHDSAVSRMSYKELLLLVHELPETQRTVFNMFVFDDLSHKDIAEHLGITENNSRWHLNDARRRLKERLKNINHK